MYKVLITIVVANWILGILISSITLYSVSKSTEPEAKRLNDLMAKARKRHSTAKIIFNGIIIGGFFFIPRYIIMISKILRRGL